MDMDWNKHKKVFIKCCVILGTSFSLLSLIAKKKINEQQKDEDLRKDKYIGAGKPTVIQLTTAYDKYYKRIMDKFLSFIGLVILSPVYILISFAIYFDDPGPILFTQKRVGKNKEFFKLHKFRTMKMNTPHDVPTHQLKNPEQYITKTGRFLRKYSLDELPQIWDIFIGNMSIVGPRPALWNQTDLIEEREKYGANDIAPGLTGWAQINGRDELDIPVKAKLDGEYMINRSFKFDMQCLFGTIISVLQHDGVVEGGTGEIHKIGRQYTKEKTNEELIGYIGFGQPVEVDYTKKVKILITGSDSYIGDAFRQYAMSQYGYNFEIDVINMLNNSWRKKDFSQFDFVFHVAGIAHADIDNISDNNKEKYYKINTDLAVEVAEKAKLDGVKKFIFMSSMIVYGDAESYGKRKYINLATVPKPANFYGDSKLQADVKIRTLADEHFKVIVLRPPIIYGNGSKGNYPILVNLAKKMPIFPDITNEHSMIYIENFCEFLCQLMLIKNFERNAVVLMPQNSEWSSTIEIIRYIREENGKSITQFSAINPLVYMASKFPGKIGKLANKAFGNYCYEQEMSEYEGIDYRIIGLKESIHKSEKGKNYIIKN